MAKIFNRTSPISRGKKFAKGDGGAILTIFIGLIIAVVLIQPIADDIYGGTNKNSIANTTQITAANGTTINLEGKAVSSFSAFNSTNNTGNYTAPYPVVGSGNYTISNYQNVNGKPTAQIDIHASKGYYGYKWNISYDFEPQGYLESSPSRTIFQTTLIFAALAALVFVIVVLFKKRTFRNMIGMK